MNISGLRRLYADRAANWPDAPSFPLHSQPQHDGSWHAEFPTDGSVEIANTERGTEYGRIRFTDTDELLYWVFGQLTKDAGFGYELKHRVEGQDSRRIAFAHAISEMAKVSPEWSDRLRSDIDDILRAHPYFDAPER